MNRENKQFELVWLDGKKEVISGFSISHTMAKAGIGNGAIPALDYWREVKDPIEGVSIEEDALNGRR